MLLSMKVQAYLCTFLYSAIIYEFFSKCLYTLLYTASIQPRKIHTNVCLRRNHVLAVNFLATYLLLKVAQTY